MFPFLSVLLSELDQSSPHPHPTPVQSGSSEEAVLCQFCPSVASISFNWAGRQTMVLSQNEEFSIEGRRTDDKQSVRLHLRCCVAANVQTGFWKKDAPSRRKYRKLHRLSHLTNDSSCIKCYNLQLDNSCPSLFHFSHIIRPSSISCVNNSSILHPSPPLVNDFIILLSLFTARDLSCKVEANGFAGTQFLSV